MGMTEMNDRDDLDDFFAAARDARTPASDALMARVLDDGLTVQAEMAERDVATPDIGAGTGLWAGLLSALGGWPAIAGLGTAAVAGVWIGFSPALGLGDALSVALGGQSAEAVLDSYVTSYGFSFDEGDAG